MVTSKKDFSVGDELEWITAPQGVQEEQMAEAYMYGQKILRFAFMSGSINLCRPFDRVSEIFALHVIGLLPMQRTKQKAKAEDKVRAKRAKKEKEEKKKDKKKKKEKKSKKDKEEKKAAKDKKEIQNETWNLLSL